MAERVSAPRFAYVIVCAYFSKAAFERSPQYSPHPWCDEQKRTRIELCFMCYNSNIGDVVFAKARRKARISMWSKGSSLFMGLESSENGGFPPFLHREQKRKIWPFRDRKARRKSFMERSSLPRLFSSDPVQHAV